MVHGRTMQRLIGLMLFGFASQSMAAAPEAVPGQFLVKYKSSVKVSDIAEFGILKLNHEKIIDVNYDNNYVVIQKPVIENQAFDIESLSALPDVEIVEPNYIYRINKLPNDPQLNKLWGMVNTGQKDSGGALGRAGVDIGAEKAWDITTGSNEVLVGVIDTGVDYKNENLAGNTWVNEAELNGKPGVDDDNNGYVDDVRGWNWSSGKKGDPLDDHGHGTHVSGTIGARGDDNVGVVGVNWKVRIMALKFLGADGSGDLNGAIKAIDYGTQMGAKILSNSWGGGGPSDLLKAAITRAHEKNVLFVAAAGNDGTDNDAAPTYPANYDVPNVLSVAAIDNQGQLASFSCYGRNTVDVAAPGVNVYSSIPKGFASWSGTSMATPHVSGIAALLLSVEPNMTPVELKERIVKTAVPLVALKGKVVSGGLANAYTALTNTVPPPDPNDPANWTDTVSLAVSTPHPYENKKSYEYVVEVPGAKKFSAYFSKFDTESGYDKVTFYNRAGDVIGLMSGKASESWSPVFEGDYVRIVLKADDSIARYGFDITKAAYK